MNAAKVVKGNKAKTQPEAGKCEIGTYQNKPVIVLDADSPNPFGRVTFGLAKAKKIVKHFDSIKAFVDSEGQSIE